MKILSFDVGIKNLAYCLVNFTDKNREIIDWGVIDIFTDFTENNNKCENIKRKGCCGNNADLCFKKGEESIFLCSKTVCQKKHQDYINNGWKKEKLKNQIKTTKDISLKDYGKSIKKQLDDKKMIDFCPDYIIIENQPVLKNPTMKSIQMMLFSYFVFFLESNECKILLYSARSKLKIAGITTSEKYEDDKTGKKGYNNRKKESINWVQLFLEKDKNTWLDFYSKHKKKDDLSDCFIQAMSWYESNFSKNEKSKTKKGILVKDSDDSDISENNLENKNEDNNQIKKKIRREIKTDKKEKIEKKDMKNKKEKKDNIVLNKDENIDDKNDKNDKNDNNDNNDNNDKNDKNEQNTDKGKDKIQKEFNFFKIKKRR
jgi:hypothetical protein